MTWLGIKSLMEDEIMARRNEVSATAAASGRPTKKPKVAGRVGMALVATELSAAVAGITALPEQFQDCNKPQVRTRAGKECEDRAAEACKNAKSNSVPGTPHKSSLQTTTNSRPTTPNRDNRADENTGNLLNQKGDVIECFLCKKLGIELPQSNHMIRNCP
eukprot:90066-Rhodomonas_salina.1